MLVFCILIVASSERRVDHALVRALHRDELTLDAFHTLRADISHALDDDDGARRSAHDAVGCSVVLDGTSTARAAVDFPHEDVSEAALRFCTQHTVAFDRCFAVVHELARLSPSGALQRRPDDHIALFASPALTRRCPRRARVYIEIERLLGRVTPRVDARAEARDVCVTLDGDAAHPVWCGPLPPRETTYFAHSLLSPGAHVVALHWAAAGATRGRSEAPSRPLHSVFFWVSLPGVALRAPTRTPQRAPPPGAPGRWTRAAALAVDVSLREFCPGSDEGELCFLIDGRALWCGEGTREGRSGDVIGTPRSADGGDELRSTGRRRGAARRPMSALAAAARRRARATPPAPRRAWWTAWWQRRSWNRRGAAARGSGRNKTNPMGDAWGSSMWPLCPGPLPGGASAAHGAPVRHSALGSRARAQWSDVVRLRVVLPSALLASLGAERSVSVEALLLHGEMPTKVRVRVRSFVLFSSRLRLVLCLLLRRVGTSSS